MKLRYFVVGRKGLLHKVSQAGVQGLWEGRRGVQALGCPGAYELRLVSVVCDDDLLPSKVYVLRLPLANGQFTEESRLTLHLFAMPDCVTADEMLQHHMEGWPADLFVQLAVALDVPVADLRVPLGVGGPLFTAAAMRVTPQQALRYLH
jgi:hypothetical protein